ncbi:MAG: 5'-methylthioadenosine/adenosylhomocysteine nucleosidase [Clostridia bacterium]|nr:5'-methylthioadenosine/adenosylhomocysteine nucleosidase [Clostridia bacterium]MBP3652490.1 5'-methylthioadenosine/adenosylhomocysteine nucleosidase [Clostridia bacterium]
MIGILCALEQEIELLLQNVENPETHKKCGYDYVIGTLRGKRVILCKCGIGKVNAAVCCQTMLLTWPVKLVINSGVAGALREPLEIGDICVATDLVQHDVDTTAVGDPVGFVSTVNQTYFRCAEWAVSGILNAAKSFDGVRALPGRIASGDQFVHEQAVKDRIVRLFDASAVEMEGGAISQVCFINGVDCAVIRAISDSSSGKHHMEYQEFMPMAAKTSADVVMRFLEGDYFEKKRAL